MGEGHGGEGEGLGSSPDTEPPGEAEGSGRTGVPAVTQDRLSVTKLELKSKCDPQKTRR